MIKPRDVMNEFDISKQSDDVNCKFSESSYVVEIVSAIIDNAL